MRRNSGMIVFQHRDEESGEWETGAHLLPGGMANLLAGNGENCDGFIVQLSYWGERSTLTEAYQVEGTSNFRPGSEVAWLKPGTSIVKTLRQGDELDSVVVQLAHISLPLMTSVVCPECALAFHPFLAPAHIAEHAAVQRALQIPGPLRPLGYSLINQICESQGDEDGPSWISEVSEDVCSRIKRAIIGI